MYLQKKTKYNSKVRQDWIPATLLLSAIKFLSTISTPD